jgi:hypothetical protein
VAPARTKTADSLFQHKNSCQEVLTGISTHGVEMPPLGCSSTRAHAGSRFPWQIQECLGRPVHATRPKDHMWLESRWNSRGRSRAHTSQVTVSR